MRKHQVCNKTVLTYAANVDLSQTDIESDYTITLPRRGVSRMDCNNSAQIITQLRATQLKVDV